MTTRSGTPYNPPHTQPTEPMDTNLEAILRAMTEQFKHLNNRFDQVEGRLGILKENYQTRTEPKLSRPTLQDHRPHHDYMDQDERVLRNPHPNVHNFGGELDLERYTDWERTMDQYLKECEMSEESKVKFVKSKLTRHARIY